MFCSARSGSEEELCPLLQPQWVQFLLQRAQELSRHFIYQGNFAAVRDGRDEKCLGEGFFILFFYFIFGLWNPTTVRWDSGDGR